MGNKKKGKKMKAAGGSAASSHDAELANEMDKLASEFGNDDDDGTILPADIAAITKFVQSTKPLQKIGAEFLDAFKRRCTLTVGFALLTFYDTLVDKELAAWRINTIYLVYRVRELDFPPTKKKNMCDVSGHPFIPFFLTVTGTSKVCPRVLTTDFEPSSAEKYVVNRILAKKASDLGALTATAIVEQFESDTEKEELVSISECECVWGEQRARFPNAPDANAIPPYIALPDKADDWNASAASSLYDVVVARVDELNGGGGGESDYIPPTLVTHIPYRFPLEPHEIPLELPPKAPRKIIVTEDEFRSMEQLSRQNSPVQEGREKGEEREEEQKTQSSSSPARSPIPTPLSPSKTLGGGENGRESNAVEQQLKEIKERPGLINSVAECATGIAVTPMEVLHRAYKEVPGLPKEALIVYLLKCFEWCRSPDNSTYQTSRQVRMVCSFVQSLIKSRVLHVRDISAELHQFAHDFMQHRETTALYRTMCEAKERETREMGPVESDGEELS